MIDISNEVRYTTARSSGPGGQNVNKVNTKVSILFSINESKILSTHQKIILSDKLNSRINKDGYIIINCEKTRSQLKNKELALASLNALINKTLIPSKKRIYTKPTKASKLKRMKNKKILSDKKTNRRSIGF
ncbi:alternative ribosome rescue aminoacyl-tRNA hydrolase ArfB [Plebeiobacterium sediminum]|uniref:Alternative ribosome rescue aminoacyl-tRNA hydrolase ArfB n=1 Tax=Plebeiibacterium sediminum TaxID=2992112 RepID=A0AAE3M4Q2_9BACT|nr:alternative ribosome rescue aminoacyl-tRNA hydrolase ArfB [Plebeiobacterium sediminum]MCW3787079.1 alternative ribosome rescue aminoacyl-tRNA hydrolase ArfB [Plebeiobacterium sediminum]